MPRAPLDESIRDLLEQILALDRLVEQATLDAVAALKDRNLAEARRVYDGDQEINRRRFEIENQCVGILTRQPIMAGDLRLLASTLVVNSELERIGDYAKGIARICLMIGAEPHLKPLVDIPRMADIAVDMLHRAVEAFVNKDEQLARQIPAEDDRVDALYNQVYRELVTYILADPAQIDRANYLMWAAHNLERTADRVTNICERAIYVATGELVELSPSDDESALGGRSGR